ncbi:hypothetical protein NDU88_004911 [Pleurodeles waltl]|uniref:Uncharacterized protein n=1 Tax=Pleurodeles waltl TaxID=8319 RepID=A0AAV7TSV8_PLEWA|nr:hypothetical protein NDU88_004911 [Pleurodeles waltl]
MAWFFVRLAHVSSLSWHTGYTLPKSLLQDASSVPIYTGLHAKASAPLPWDRAPAITRQPPLLQLTTRNRPRSGQLTVLLALSVVLLLSPPMAAGTPQYAPQLDQVPAQDHKGSPAHLSEERAESQVLGPPSHSQGLPCVTTNPRLRGSHPAVTSSATSLTLQAQPTSLASCGAAQPFSGHSAEHQWRTHFVLTLCCALRGPAVALPQDEQASVKLPLGPAHLWTSPVDFTQSSSFLLLQPR